MSQWARAWQQRSLCESHALVYGLLLKLLSLLSATASTRENGHSTEHPDKHRVHLLRIQPTAHASHHAFPTARFAYCTHEHTPLF